MTSITTHCSAQGYYFKESFAPRGCLLVCESEGIRAQTTDACYDPPRLDIVLTNERLYSIFQIISGFQTDGICIDFGDHGFDFVCERARA